MRPTSAATVSAIIVTHNRRDQLGRAVDSILSQTPRPHEVIIVDDGSTDGTPDYLRESYGDAVTVISRPHRGVSAARRCGVLAATGDWIAFLDSDDAWADGRLSVMARAVHEAPADTGCIFGDSKLVYKDRTSTVFSEAGWGETSGPQLVAEPMSSQWPYMVSLLPSSLVRREALIEAGCFQEDLESSEDLLVSFRIALRRPIVCVHDVVSIVDRTGRADSLSRRGQSSPDHFRARVLAFEETARVTGRREWRALHASAVRGWCIALARKGEACRAEALLQFKHAATLKAVLFLIFAFCGATPVRLWGYGARVRADFPQSLVPPPTPRPKTCGEGSSVRPAAEQLAGFRGK
ncbi:glycosyltransferase family 2 protein [Phenylobacterium sp.]|uniref:glycosyltransferase family 2 protein n=1 Tax=Phenylobacterium sp. TaxID=1871053 RepID=UPI002F40FC73